MRIRHSESLILIWRLADLEARQLNASMIEPSHLLLGLCKVVDLDLLALIPKDLPDRDGILEELLREVRRLRSVFRASGLDARRFRRALRPECLGDRNPPSESPRLRRSQASKQVFANAEHLAEMAMSLVFPAHLLYAVVSAGDEVRDDLLELQDVKPARLRGIAKREITSPWGEEKPASGQN